MHNLSGFQRDLLYVISGLDQPSGQQVKDELESYVDGEINHGQLYPNLDTLVNKSYVEKGPIDRRTNYYAITENGKEAIRKRRSWEDQYRSVEA
ncbi:MULTISPECIES: PadR family transcriptional regulator [Haloprofundus]|uniref:PadR family transcriptional regulator n=1 Tax=Haloprofundus TaxID=1911573 RepID=UPI000E4392B2|nr:MULTISPECIES: PadR family transcriptional regulator [Haloprofundus]QCJ45901.1 PadR family transcriptional regulator [Haloprofundus sp. MHR1]